MRRIDKMILDAQNIHDAMRPTIYTVMVHEYEPFETQIGLTSSKGIEYIKETHSSKEDAYRYIEEMEKKYRNDPDKTTIIDDYLVGWSKIIDNIPLIEEECNEREENAIEADLCH